MTIVTNPGDFMWKPLREIEVETDYAVLNKVSGTGVDRSYLLSTNTMKEWKLMFRSSYDTYTDIINFLNSKKNGHLPFTWRSHLDGVLYTVKLSGTVKVKAFSDNTSNQRPINVEFELTFKRTF